jgi:ribonuclease-3
LEYLGDAILDAVVGHVAYQYFPGKAEGFLTNARSKMVQRETLGKLAQQMGLSKLIMSSGCNITHNSYMGGNAFEALVGAVYLDRGYEACQEFWTKRVMGKYLNVNKIAYTEVNFKSKILEWSQKNRVKIEFRLEDQSQDENGSPTFEYTVVLEGIDGCRSRGFSKKESQQHACELTLKKLRSDSQFLDSIFAAKTARTQMEEMPVSVVPVVENIDEPLITLNSQTEDEPEAMEKTREQIIAEAEAQAYSVHSA